MPGLTRTRSDAIQSTAARILTDAGGITHIDSLSEDIRRVALIVLYKQLQEEHQTHYATARSHIARALRRARGQASPPDGWGGKRTTPHNPGE